MTKAPTHLSNDEWEPLVETLRSELQECGGLYNLLCRQQDSIIERKSDDVLVVNDEIETQAEAVGELRRRREEIVDQLGARVEIERRGRIRDLVPHFPEVAQPLIDALIRDINHIVRRTRQKARQNHLLLSRAMEITEQMLRVLQPESFTRTYERSGKVKRGRLPVAANRYHAVG